MDLQTRLTKIRNELRAQKVSSELAYSSMLWPENAPTASWSGRVQMPTNFDAPFFRLEAVFTRSDEIKSTPYVDLAVDADCISLEDWIRSIGGSVSGGDPNFIKSAFYRVYINSTTDSSVTFYIDANDWIATLGGYPPGYDYNDVSFTVTAISPVKGSISLRRII